MSKYVLSPSGKIIKQGEESDPTSITREMISTQEDFFSLRRSKEGPPLAPSSVSLPTSLTSKEPTRGIIATETPVFEEEKYEGEIVFPNKLLKSCKIFVCSAVGVLIAIDNSLVCAMYNYYNFAYAVA